jgi:spore germination cell wall hydrolase CwlJ-like protein
VVKLVNSIIKYLLVLVLACVAFSLNTAHQSNSTNLHVDYSIAEKQKACIKEALYFEARGESEEGLRHVLSVIHNRVQAKGFPGSYCKVIWQSKQFSYRNGTQPGIFIEIKPVKAQDKKAYALISDLAHEAAYGGFKPVLDADVLWYHTSEVKPKWTAVMQKIKTVARHHFLARTKKE